MTYHNFIKIFMYYDVKNFDSEEFILLSLNYLALSSSGTPLAPTVQDKRLQDTWEVLGLGYDTTNISVYKYSQLSYHWYQSKEIVKWNESLKLLLFSLNNIYRLFLH